MAATEVKATACYCSSRAGHSTPLLNPLRQAQQGGTQCILLSCVGDLRGALDIFNWIE